MWPYDRAYKGPWGDRRGPLEDRKKLDSKIRPGKEKKQGKSHVDVGTGFTLRQGVNTAPIQSTLIWNQLQEAHMESSEVRAKQNPSESKQEGKACKHRTKGEDFKPGTGGGRAGVGKVGMIWGGRKKKEEELNKGRLKGNIDHRHGKGTSMESWTKSMKK